VAQRRRHVGVAQHAGQLTPSRLSTRHLDVARGHATRRSLRHHQMVIGVRGDLRQVGDHERLTLPCRRHDVLERFPDARSRFAPDALIHLVEHEGRHGVVGRQHDLQREHQARQLAARGDPRERPGIETQVQLNLEHDVLRTEGAVRSARLQMGDEPASRHP